MYTWHIYQVLDELDDELHNIQNQLARKLDFIKESKRQKVSGVYFIFIH